MRALVISGTLLAAVLAGCGKTDATRTAPATAQAAKFAERAWSEVTALGSGGGTGLFEALTTSPRGELRALNYTVSGAAWGLLDSVSASTAGTTVELTSLGLRPVDDWITRESASRNPTEMAAALDSLDHLIARRSASSSRDAKPASMGSERVQPHACDSIQ